MLRPYFRGLPLILGVMVLAYLAASQFVNYSTPQYEGTAKIRLADIQEGVSNSNLFEDFDVFVSSNKIAAEIELIRSRILIDRMLDRVDLETEMYRVGTIKSVELFSQSPFQVDFIEVDPSHFGKTWDLHLKNRNAFRLSGPNKQEIHGKMGDTLRVSQSLFSIQINDSLISQKPDIQIVDHYQFKRKSRADFRKSLQENLDVTSIEKDVPVLRINFRSPSAEKAALIPNLLAEAYIADYIETKYKAAQKTVAFLNEQIENVAVDLARSEQGIQRFRDSRSITNIRQETETDLRQLSQQKIQYTNLTMRFQAVKDLEAYIDAGKGNFLELAPNFEAFTDLLSTEIVKNIKALQAEKKDLLLEYTEEEQLVQVVDQKIADLTGYLEESIHNTRKNLEVQCQKLKEDIEVAEGAFVEVPENERLLKIMEREFGIFQQTYQFLNKKKIEAEIAEAAQISFHRVISPAEISQRPVAPNRTIIVAVSVLLGMFLAIAFIFLMHMVKGKVNDVQSIENTSVTPVGLAVPHFKSKSAAKAFFRREVLKMELRGLIGDGKTICLSSFRKGAGVVFNGELLAEAMAEQGRKVLVMGTDEIKQTECKGSIQILETAIWANQKPEALKNQLTDAQRGYDVTILLNPADQNPLFAPLMSLSDTNLMVLDSRKTSLKRVEEANLFGVDYQLDNLSFLLNRAGYTPGLIQTMIRLGKKGFRSRKTRKTEAWNA